MVLCSAQPNLSHPLSARYRLGYLMPSDIPFLAFEFKCFKLITNSVDDRYKSHQLQLSGSLNLARNKITPLADSVGYGRSAWWVPPLAYLLQRSSDKCRTHFKRLIRLPFVASCRRNFVALSTSRLAAGGSLVWRIALPNRRVCLADIAVSLVCASLVHSSHWKSLKTWTTSQSYMTLTY